MQTSQVFLSLVSHPNILEKRYRAIERVMGIQALQEALCGFIDQQKGVLLEADEIQIRKNPLGKPYVVIDGKVRKDIVISISHSYPYAMAVVRKGEGAVGCDVERVRDFAPQTAAVFLTANEKRALAHYSPRVRKIKTTLAWSYKESVLKAIGTGLRTHPRKVDVALMLGKKKPATLPVRIGKKSYIFQAWSKSLPKGYVCTVVAEIGGSARM